MKNRQAPDHDFFVECGHGQLTSFMSIFSIKAGF